VHGAEVYSDIRAKKYKGEARLFYFNLGKGRLGDMNLIWCTKKGVAHGFQNELVACVACVCKRRKTCKPYAAVPLQEVAAANLESKKQGHAVAEDLPLFEALIKPKTRL